MGYIPIVRDEQVLIYANRQLPTKQLIPQPDKVQEISFFDAMKEYPDTSHTAKTYSDYDFNDNRDDDHKERILEIVRMKENEMTGKGEQIDYLV